MNWVFLGDSLTEGVGSQRISYVTQLVTRIRAAQREISVHEMRLRNVDPRRFNPQIEVNVAGKMDLDEQRLSSDLWLWNLACEGQTIETDLGWLPLIGTLHPELIVIFRGSLESIVRPSVHPWWVPGSWRGYAAMDPRCYFSTTWWRKAKQQTLDTTRQKVRLKLLARDAGKPLMDQDVFADHVTTLLRRLRELKTRMVLLGLLSVDEARFPGSPKHFDSVNARLREIAAAENVEFFDWAAELKSKAARDELFYRDSFHPNLAGANALAEILQSHLFEK